MYQYLHPSLVPLNFAGHRSLCSGIGRLLVDSREAPRTIQKWATKEDSPLHTACYMHITPQFSHRSGCLRVTSYHSDLHWSATSTPSDWWWFHPFFWWSAGNRQLRPVPSLCAGDQFTKHHQEDTTSIHKHPWNSRLTNVNTIPVRQVQLHSVRGDFKALGPRRDPNFLSKHCTRAWASWVK